MGGADGTGAATRMVMRKCKQVNVARCDKHQAAQVCEERAGPTPSHPEPGRATAQRQGYWGDDSLGDEVHAPVQALVFAAGRHREVVVS